MARATSAGATIMREIKDKSATTTSKRRPAQVGRSQVAYVGPLHDLHAGVPAEPLEQLAVADVDGDDVSRPVGEQAVSEPPRRGAGVEGRKAHDVEFEMMYGGVQLLAAPAGKTGWEVLDHHRFGRGDLTGRLVCHRARDKDPPGTYECGRLGPTGDQPSGNELDIEPLLGTQFRPVPGLTDALPVLPLPALPALRAGEALTAVAFLPASATLSGAARLRPGVFAAGELTAAAALSADLLLRAAGASAAGALFAAAVLAVVVLRAGLTVSASGEPPLAGAVGPAPLPPLKCSSR